jgi:amino acid transporter
MAPTVVFVVCLLAIIGWGLAVALLSGGHPHPAVHPPPLPPPQKAASAWLLLKAFASGCTAMTGVEAVSNGVQTFREPVVPAARPPSAGSVGFTLIPVMILAEVAR